MMVSSWQGYTESYASRHTIVERLYPESTYSNPHHYLIIIGILGLLIKLYIDSIDRILLNE
ncbi:hypothetical protein P280DRAFT_99575 [Massarina eburnea CBS 473.64]|uniref:Uncharacterized protein n=1 Tax=Massarina eburnea CBS 473.64 TaxID=1395130 RepID=A0A6A6RQJ9_9PLEO|nr:hypothetical protein P280DRAFT_99575 [Massarina eburnea CBS 473.64]